MVTQEEFREAARRALGTVGLAARERVRPFLLGQQEVLELRYDDPVQWEGPTGLLVLLEHPSVHLSDGQEWLRIWVGDNGPQS